VSIHEGIVILGAPRSGTTLLRRLFDAHQDIDCPGETYLLGACARFCQSEITPQGVAMGVVPGLSQLGVAADEVRRQLRELAFGFHRDHARAKGKARWAMKTAVDSFYLAEVEHLIMGHAHVVAIVRHGLDAVASMAEMTAETGAFLSELHEYVKSTPWPSEAYARAWTDISRGLAELAERHPDDVTLIRYEDLVANPSDVFGRVLERVGASWDDTLLDRAMTGSTSVGLGDWKTYQQSAVTDRSVGRHRDLPSPGLARLVPIVAEELRRHGYEVPEAQTESTEKADRRTRLAMLMNLAKREE
jgi:protein-tyrosine sulfotransferase